MRRTRANPSPTGLKALPMNEKKRKTTTGRKAPAKRAKIVESSTEDDEQPEQQPESQALQVRQPTPEQEEPTPTEPTQPSPPTHLSPSPSQPTQPTRFSPSKPSQLIQPSPSKPSQLTQTLSHPSGMMTNNMREREAIYFKKYGKKMPKVRKLAAKHRKYALATPAQPEFESESEEDLGEEYMDGPSFTQFALDTRDWHVPERPSQSTDTAETSCKEASQSTNKPEMVYGGPLSYRRTESSSYNSSFINTHLEYDPPSLPAIRSRKVASLTKISDIEMAAHALKSWVKRDASRRAPTPEEMEALLDSFYAQEQPKIAAKSQPQPAPREEHVEQQEQTRVEIASGEEDNDEQTANDEFMGNPSEVATETQQPHTPEHHTPEQQNTVPQTPIPSGGLQESRGIWAGLSAVKNMIATPLNFFRRSSVSAEATNINPVPGEFTFRHSHTLNAQAYPSTPMPSRRPHKAGAQTERKGRPQTPTGRLAQTERRRRPITELKPIHERGVLTQDQIAEIHRKQDREKQRRAQLNLSEEDDTEFPYSRLGSKRKRPQRRVASKPENTFTVPDGDSDGGEAAPQIQSPLHNRDIKWPGPRLMFGYDDDEQGWREEYARKYHIPMYQVPRDVLVLRRMFMGWTSRSEYVQSGGPPINFNDWDLRQKEAERIAADMAGLPLWPGVDTPYGGYDSFDYKKRDDITYRERDRPRTMNQYRHLFPPYPEQEVVEIPKPTTARPQSEQAADNDRVPPYTGSVVATNANLYQRPNQGPPPVPLFSKSQTSILSKKRELQDLTSHAGDKGVPQTPLFSKSQTTSMSKKSTGTYGFSYSDEESSDDEEPVALTPPPKPRPVNAQLPQQQAQPAANNTAQQTPQRQNKLSNAPQLQTPAIPEIPLSPAEKATAKALKFAPAHPSGLRNMTKMSPLQIQQENLALQSTTALGQNQKENAAPQGTTQTTFGQIQREKSATQITAQNDIGQNEKENIPPQDPVQNTVAQKDQFLATMQQDYNNMTFDPEVLEYVNSIPEDQIYTTKLPDELYIGWDKERSVAEKATDKYFT